MTDEGARFFLPSCVFDWLDIGGRLVAKWVCGKDRLRGRVAVFNGKVRGNTT